MTRFYPILLNFVFSRWTKRTWIASSIAFTGWLGQHTYDQYQRSRDESNIQRLNQMVAIYQQHSGMLPDVNLVELYRSGLTKDRLHSTPFGGYYRLDPKQALVYNPMRSR